MAMPKKSEAKMVAMLVSYCASGISHLAEPMSYYGKAQTAASMAEWYRERTNDYLSSYPELLSGRFADTLRFAYSALGATIHDNEYNPVYFVDEGVHEPWQTRAMRIHAELRATVRTIEAIYGL